MARLIVLLRSPYSVLKAERLCAAAGIPCETIPVPRQVSSECGIALEVDERQELNAAALFTENNLQFALRRLD